MHYVFGDCTLDTQLYILHRGGRPIPLRAKVFQVLHYLLTQRERVISKQDLCEEVWPHQFISDAALESVVKAVRRVVGDDGRSQWCIQTRRGQGYRFAAPVTMTTSLPMGHGELSRSSAPAEGLGHSSRVLPPRPQLMVDRQAELAQLHQWWLQACEGTRQVAFITGEAGIGKTSLVEAFVARVAAEEDAWVGHGQCIEQYGAGEAYLPLLEALGRLCRGPDGEHLLMLLRQHAPSWLVQMPALLPAAERAALQRLASGVTQARMLRELAEAVEVLTAERPLIIVLEDLHWSDVSTLNWLAYVARRHDSARLLVLGTYRPVETLTQTHSLRTIMPELRRQQLCHVLEVADLAPGAVAAYLRRRFGGKPLPIHLSRMIHQRTDGNPLFMVSLVDDMVRQGGLYEGPEGWELSGDIEAGTVEIPESLRQLIEQQLEGLEPEDQRLLEAASVAGAECSTAALAVVIDRKVEEVEERCAVLARQHLFLQAHGTAEWPDGTVATRYSFRHALYQEALYNRVPARRRVQMHQRIGGRLEAAYGAQAGEVAAELAVHFMRGRDAQRAVQYLYAVGENALLRGAHQEAITHLSQGLAGLTTLPDTPERATRELTLQLAMGNALIPIKGYTQEVESIYIQAQQLCQQIGETPQIFPALRGLLATYAQRGKLQTAREHAETFLRLAQRQGDSALLLQAHRILASIWLHLGAFACAREHVERGLALYNVQHHCSQTFLYAQDPGISCLTYAALSLWCLGYPDQALQTCQKALALARALAQPHSLAFAHSSAATLYQHRHEVQRAREQAEASIALCREQGFAFRSERGTILLGWALTRQGQQEEGMTQMHQSLAAHRMAGIELGLAYYLALLAEGYRQAGQGEEGLIVLTEALATAQRTGDRWCEAELYRLQGEFLLQQDDSHQQQAEACFQQALVLARQQQAKSWELRAAMSLGRLWHQHGEREAARQMLAPVYNWFTEGFDTVDLQQAKTLLEAWSR